MNSRTITNIILFLIATILITILVVDSTETKKIGYSLTTLTEQSVSSIEITRLTAEPLKFNKKNNIWYMISPYQVRANTFYIESLLRISQAKVSSVFSINDQDKNKFKLKPPQASLKLNTQLFLFGTNEQLNLKRYILTSNKLYLLPDRYFYILNSRTTGFIDHALIGKNQEITAIKLAQVQLEFINSKWQQSPNQNEISTDDIVQLILEWNNSQAIEISKLADNSTENKIFSIILKLKDKNQTITFDIIKTENEYLFVRADLKLQYKLNFDMANRLLNLSN